MKIIIDTTSKKYLANIRARFDNRLMLGQERYVGWMVGNLFSVRYYSGKEFGRRNYPIANKAIGIVKSMKNKTIVYYYNFQGLTDPISLAALFLPTLLLFMIIGAPSPILFAFGWVIAVAITTWVCTRAFSSGQVGMARIDDFLRHRDS